MRFEMTLDTTNVVTTCVLVVIVAVPGLVVPLVAGPAFVLSWGELPARLFELALAASPFVVLGGAAIFAPCGLELVDDQLHILRRVAPPVAIPLSSIARVEDGPKPTIRVFGMSGILGSFGLFSSTGFGQFKLYATRRGPYLALRLKDGPPVVVTPDDLPHFRQMLERRLGGHAPRAAGLPA
jgi:hypothetical protein